MKTKANGCCILDLCTCFQPLHTLSLCNIFYARQLYRQVLLRARISYGNSVCPSVTTQYQIMPRWDRDSGFSPYDSLESLVSNEVIWYRWVRRFPSNEGIKEGYPLRNHNFTTFGSSSVRTVADRHRLAAYHNNHCSRAFRGYQHRLPWMILNPKSRVFSDFFCYFRLRHTLRVNFRWNILEIDQDNLRTKLNWCCRASHEH